MEKTGPLNRITRNNTLEEVEQAIAKLNNNRAPGPDNTQAELLKADATEI